MFKTVIWATDGSEAADRALPYAKSLAAGEKLVVVHCKELLGGRSGGYPVLTDESDVQTKISDQVEAIRADGFDVSLEIGSSHASGAAHVISDVARKVDADVIVVGTRGHTAIAGLLLGGVTQRLLHIAPCPVLAVPSRVPQRRGSEAKAEREVVIGA